MEYKEVIYKEAGEYREQAKARQKYLRKKRKCKEKTAFTYLDLMTKEANVVNRASKAINGVKPIKPITNALPAVKPVTAQLAKPKKVV